jgi:RNA polymerase sigma-70 factor (ECF subfamily)
MTDWREVVEQHGQVVWQTAYRLLGNHADASDCFQKVFLDAVQVARREPVHQWPALLRQMATARALDLLRDRYRRRNRSEPMAAAAEATANTPLPEQEAEAAELSDHLRLALARLPDRQAEAFCLRSIEGMSYEEIARRLEVEVNHVGVLLNRARTRLQQLLDRFVTSGNVKQENSP